MLVKCKTCGKEIAKGVKKCVSCGADQRNFFSRHKILTGILAVFIVAGISLAVGGGGKTSIAPTTAPGTTQSAKNKPEISKVEFDQLKSGMTYEEAIAIIGGPGEVISESGNKGEALHTIMYQCKGEKGLGANANIMFQGNKLQNKAQFGLE